MMAKNKKKKHPQQLPHYGKKELSTETINYANCRGIVLFFHHEIKYRPMLHGLVT